MPAVAEIVMGLKALHPQHQENLRFHLAAGSAICPRDWWVDPKGAACLAVLAATRDIPPVPIPDDADPDELIRDPSVVKAMISAYNRMARAVGGPAAWHRHESSADEESLRASIEEAVGA